MSSAPAGLRVGVIGASTIGRLVDRTPVDARREHRGLRPVPRRRRRARAGRDAHGARRSLLLGRRRHRARTRAPVDASPGERRTSGSHARRRVVAQHRTRLARRHRRADARVRGRTAQRLHRHPGSRAAARRLSALRPAERGADAAHRRLAGERDLTHGRPRGGRGPPLPRRRSRSHTRCAPRTWSGSRDERRRSTRGRIPWRATRSSPRTTCGARWSTSSNRSSGTCRPVAPGRDSARFGAHFAPRVAELEGYARPLWGIVPLVAGGGTFDHWDRWVAGLAHGTDPESAEYWGPCADGHRPAHGRDGRHRVRARRSRPSTSGIRSTGRQRDHVVEWLRGVERREPAQNNWQFFRLLVQMGLERVGVAIDREAQARSIELHRLVRRRRRLVHRRTRREHRLLRAVRAPHLRPRPRGVGSRRPRCSRALRRARATVRAGVRALVRA